MNLLVQIKFLNLFLYSSKDKLKNNTGQNNVLLVLSGRISGADPGFQVRGRIYNYRENFGVFCVNNHDFTQKIIFFSAPGYVLIVRTALILSRWVNLLINILAYSNITGYFARERIFLIYMTNILLIDKTYFKRESNYNLLKEKNNKK